MLVFSDGTAVGSVGGGTGEQRIRLAALEVIRERKSRLFRITLNDDVAMQEGMICGGTMETYIEWIEDPDLYRELTQLMEHKTLAVFWRNLTTHQKKIVLEKDLNQADAFLSNEEWQELLHRQHFVHRGETVLEAVVPYEKLIIFGGGHVARPIAETAARCEFEVTLVDDRAEFANQERFPWASCILAKPFEEALQEISFDESTYVVMVTRGHAYDTVCLREVLKHSWKYIGMIGSKKRVKTLLDNLEAEGYARKDLDRIHTPIGLPIGAETPDEIAVSIMAQVIAVKRGRIASFDAWMQEK